MSMMPNDSSDSFAQSGASAVLEIDDADVEVLQGRGELRETLERERMKGLSRQAYVIMATRAAKRVGILANYRRLFTEAVAAGFESTPRFWYARDAVAVADATASAYAAAAAAADAAAYSDADAYTAAATDAAAAAAADAAAAAAAAYTDVDDAVGAAADDAAGHAWKVTSFDFSRLLKLVAHPTTLLDRPLSGWDDARLGPLWPEGAPEWYQLVEAESRELEEILLARRIPV